MAEDESQGDVSGASSRRVEQSANSEQRRPPIQNRRSSVRFSEDIEFAEDATPENQQPGLQNLRINTTAAQGSSDANSQPIHRTRKAASPVSPASARTRDRGYSLRRSLFTRGISNQSEHHDIELAEAGPSRRGQKQDADRIEEEKGKHQTGVSVSPIIEHDLVATASGGGSSTSTYKKGRERTGLGRVALPNYNVWARKRSRKSALVQQLKSYRKTVLNVIFRRQDTPPSKDGRHIQLDASREEDLIDERTGKGYIGNTIRSSRYTLWDFLPRQLFFQFSKLANAYFLLISILQMIPGLSTVGTYTTLAPLLVFVAISMAKEGYDDVRRYKLDQIENKKEVRVMYIFRLSGT